MRFHRTTFSTSATILALALTVALAGCGGESTPGPVVRKAFADTSTQDLSKVQAILRDVFAPYNAAYIDFLNALNDEDLPAARIAIDKADAALVKAASRMRGLGRSSVTTVISDYLATMRGVTRSADRVLAYYEDEDSPPSARVENRLSEKFQTATLAAQKADRELLDRLLDNASPEDRKRMRAEARALQKSLDKQLDF